MSFCSATLDTRKIDPCHAAVGLKNSANRRVFPGIGTGGDSEITPRPLRVWDLRAGLGIWEFSPLVVIARGYPRFLGWDGAAGGGDFRRSSITRQMRSADFSRPDVVHVGGVQPGSSEPGPTKVPESGEPGDRPHWPECFAERNVHGKDMHMHRVTSRIGSGTGSRSLVVITGPP